MTSIDQAVGTGRSIIELIKETRALLDSSFADRRRRKDSLLKVLDEHQKKLTEIANNYVSEIKNFAEKIHFSEDADDFQMAIVSLAHARVPIVMMREEAFSELQGYTNHIHDHADHKVRSVSNEISSYLEQLASFFRVATDLIALRSDSSMMHNLLSDSEEYLERYKRRAEELQNHELRDGEVKMLLEKDFSSSKEQTLSLARYVLDDLPERAGTLAKHRAKIRAMIEDLA